MSTHMSSLHSASSLSQNEKKKKHFSSLDMSGKTTNMQYFSLRWNNHPVNLVSVFSGLYDSETLVDVTLAAGGKQIMAHKMLLSACSDYFQVLFSTNPCQHPIVILKDISFDDLQTVVQFMYNGIVNVSSDKLPGVLKTADTLQIKGLGEKFNEGVGHLIDGPSGNDAKALKNRLLSVPSTQSGGGSGSRQLSTESLPEYLLRSRDFSPRQASFDSPHQSFDSQSGTLNPKASSPIPSTTPSSPPPKHLRKKFRRLSGCGSSGERVNSVEEADRSPFMNRDASPGRSFLPSRQNSNSSEQEQSAPQNNSANTTSFSGTTVAKKKRELFSSARSSRSNESNKSSMSEHSKDTPDNNSVKKSSMSSSGQSMSQEEPNNATCVQTSSSKSPSRSMDANKSPSKNSGEEPKEVAEEDSVVSALNTKFKRGRFLLKRQSRLEKITPGDSSPLALDTPPIDHKSDYISSNSFENVIKSSPSSPLNYNYPTSLSPPVASQHNLTLSSLPHPPLAPSFDPPISSASSPPPHQLPYHPSNPLGGSKSPIPSPLGGVVDCHSPSLQSHPYSPSPLSPPHHPHSLQSFHHPSMKLPHVRVTPDSEGTKTDVRSALPPVPNMSLLYPAFEHERRLFKSRSFDHDPFFPSTRPLFPTPGYHPHPPGGILLPNLSSQTTTSAPPALHSSVPLSSTPSGTLGSSSDQFGHCPKARDGPALGCNFCWNTTDINGRILRRKTKYHCPECQANLCIVPCFQSYHEALEKDERQTSA